MIFFSDASPVLFPVFLPVFDTAAGTDSAFFSAWVAAALPDFVPPPTEPSPDFPAICPCRGASAALLTAAISITRRCVESTSTSSIGPCILSGRETGEMPKWTDKTTACSRTDTATAIHKLRFCKNCFTDRYSKRHDHGYPSRL